ncbi:MAG: WXG100 family type VII secretion target [Anaerolineales bacterium]|nr:WXG100 family type VII secretion target [Anaerolineales bacterium]
MSIFNFVRGEVDNVMSGIGQQQQIASGVLDTLKGYVPKVQSAWIGGDADEFAADVARKIVPAMIELIAAIGGVNLNLTQAASIIDQADNKARGLVDNLGDMFGQI